MRSMGRGTSRGTLVEPLLPRRMRIKRVDDVRRLLESQVRAVIHDAALGTVERARTVTYVGLALLRTIELGDLESRVQALEIADPPTHSKESL